MLSEGVRTANVGSAFKPAHPVLGSAEQFGIDFRPLALRVAGRKGFYASYSLASFALQTSDP